MLRHLNSLHPKAFMQFQKVKKRSENKKALSDRYYEKNAKYLWTYFEDAGDGFFKCNICDFTMPHGIKYRHLEKKHPEVFEQCKDIKETAHGSYSRKKDNSPNFSIYRTGWIRRFLKRLDNKRCECTVCHKVLKVPPGDTSNLKRHVRKIHPFYYEQEVNAYKEALTNKRQFETENFEVVEYVMEDVDSNDPSDNTDAIIDSIETQDPNGSNPDITITERDTDSTAGEVSMESNQLKFEDIETSDIIDPDMEEKIKQICVKNIEDTRHRNKTCIWNFYVSIKNNVLYRCMFCSRDIAILPKKVSNLTRHIATQHPAQYKLILKHAPQSATCTKKQLSKQILEEPYSKEFLFLDNGCYKCKDCNKLIICGDNLEMLSKHVQGGHCGNEDNQTGPIIADDSEFIVALEEESKL